MIFTINCRNIIYLLSINAGADKNGIPTFYILVSHRKSSFYRHLEKYIQTLIRTFSVDAFLRA